MFDVNAIGENSPIGDILEVDLLMLMNFLMNYMNYIMIIISSRKTWN